MDSEDGHARHPSVNRLLERMASEIGPPESSGGQYAPFGVAPPPPTSGWPPDPRGFPPPPDMTTAQYGSPQMAPDHAAYQHSAYHPLHDTVPPQYPPPVQPPQSQEYAAAYSALQQQYGLTPDSGLGGFPLHHQQHMDDMRYSPVTSLPRHDDVAAVLRQDELRHYALQQEELRRFAAQHDRMPPQEAPHFPVQRQRSSPPGYHHHHHTSGADALLFHSSTPPPHLRRTPPLAQTISGDQYPDQRDGRVGGEEGQFGTARITDNLAAHLSGLDAPLYEPVPPRPPPPAPAAGNTSFLQSLFGGWFGGASAADSLHQLTFSSSPEPEKKQQEEVVEESAPAGEEESAPAAPVDESPAAPTAPVLAPPVTPEQQRKQTAPEPRKPSYSAVLAKPPPSAAGPAAPPPRAGLGSDKRGTTAAARSSGPPQQETTGGGGGGRRGSRGGRRRRSSGAETKTAKPAPAGEGTPVRTAPTLGEAAPAEQTRQQEPKQTDGGKKKKKKAPRSGSVDDAETLNNNPGRAQPPVQRRPLNYNNNLGSSSTLGPAQTHVHAPPPPPPAGDSQKKLDVNVGKQKNCGKTSNESKKVAVGEPMNKPDNKTLSQSRSAQPLNLLTPGGAAKSERVSKELAFRPRPGRGGRARRDADDSSGGELVRRVCAGLAPGLTLALALLGWLAHLVSDVAIMSSRLMWLAALAVAEAAYLRVLSAVTGVKRAVSTRAAALRAWWKRPRASSPQGPPGLVANITLPGTGDEAMKRLLACKDKDPYSILGVTRDCSDADIKKYYRRQALLVHPDKSRTPGADEAFKILRRAFELVGFPEHRAAFDSQAKEQQAVDAAFRAYTEELMTRLREKIEETQNTLRCNNCNQRHRRTKTQRPCYAARDCASCKIQHAAREGDIWAESSWLGLLWRYYACMDGAVYDITEWAGCQAQSLKHLQANHHTVQYRIISGAKKHRPPPADEPTDRDLEDILNNLYSGSLSGEQAAGGRRRGARRRAH